MVNKKSEKVKKNTVEGRFPYNGETPSNNEISNIILLKLFGIAAPSDGYW